MKIAIVHSYYSSDQPSGENVAVDGQVDALRGAGHDVDLIAIRTDDVRHQRAYSLRAALTTATGIGQSPIESLVAHRPDVVHVHNLFPNWGTTWFNNWRGPLITTLHNYRVVCAAGTLFRDGHPCHDCLDGSGVSAVRHACYRNSRLASLPLAIATRRTADRHPIVRRSNRLVSLSPRAHAEFLAMGIPADKLAMVPNFVSGEARVKPPPQDAPWVYVGRLTPEKGIDQLVGVWPRDRRLEVYGDGPLALELGRRDLPGVSILGPLRHDRVHEVLQRARGLVFPSVWSEGSPMIYAEALAAGLPTVAASGNSVADDIDDCGSGVVFDDFVDVPNALSRAEDRWSDLSSAARARYETSRSPEAWLPTMEDIYRQAIREADVRRA